MNWKRCRYTYTVLEDFDDNEEENGKKENSEEIEILDISSKLEIKINQIYS